MNRSPAYHRAVLYQSGNLFPLIGLFQPRLTFKWISISFSFHQSLTFWRPLSSSFVATHAGSFLFFFLPLELSKIKDSIVTCDRCFFFVFNFLKLPSMTQQAKHFIDWFTFIWDHRRDTGLLRKSQPHSGILLTEVRRLTFQNNSTTVWRHERGL